MNRLKIFFSAITVLSSICVKAQKTEINTYQNKDFDYAVALYNDNRYAASQNLFEKINKNTNSNATTKEDCEYYLAISTIKMNELQGNSLMQNFVKNYPTSTRKNEAILETGNYYFEQGKPTIALEWLEQVNTQFLSSKQEDDYNFKMAYSLFSDKEYTKAKHYFLPLTRSKTYKNQALYYYGYIAYLQDDFKTATTYFNKIKNDTRYEKEIAYYLMNINFKEKEYAKVVATGTKLLETAHRKSVSEISKIIGESYFYLGEYENAILHLKKYRGIKGKFSNTDHYLLGYAYYKVEDYHGALTRFNKIITGKDAVAQNAYYHLGECYLKMDKKFEALNAFKNSSQMDFNLEIKEDAWYNYAKLSYEIGNPYKSTAEVLQEFIAKYPNSTKAININKIIIKSYISANDYAGALDYYDQQHLVKDATHQRISMYQGMFLFQNANYKEALPFFQFAANKYLDRNIQAEATYWKAETYYRLNNFQQALNDFQKFTAQKEAKKINEYKHIYYNLAYTYFKLKKYEKAKSNFEAYLNSKPTDKVKKDDSYTRLGDCNFIAKSYWTAMENYNKVIDAKGIDDDYAQYQKAISYGFVARNERKIETLVSFSKEHPNSSYKDDAAYQLGNAYINAKNDTEAIKAFDILIKTYPKSLYVPKALLKQGLIYFNDNEAIPALNKYKYIVKTYPNSNEAQQAINNAKRVYVAIDKVDEYAAWIKNIDFVTVSDTDLDNTMYEAAELKYIENSTKQAISSFKKYLINFPKGLHALKAHFYSAQAYFSLNEAEKSITHYLYVINENPNEYTEQSLARLAQIYLEQSSWTDAIPVLERLEMEANFPQNILFAQSNLMKGYYDQKDYIKTVTYAEKVLDNKKTDDQIKSDATIFIARSAMQTNNMPKAKKAYEKVAKIASGALMAEALYYDAYFKHEEKKYDTSNTSIQKLTADYASYKYWGIKGLILMAKNNDGLNDAFQATYILESVIKNYSQYADLIEEATQVLEAIKTKEALKNSTENTEESELTKEETPESSKDETDVQDNF